MPENTEDRLSESYLSLTPDGYGPNKRQIGVHSIDIVEGITKRRFGEHIKGRVAEATARTTPIWLAGPLVEQLLSNSMEVNNG